MEEVAEVVVAEEELVEWVSVVFGAGLVALTPGALYAVVTVDVCWGGSSAEKAVFMSSALPEPVEEDAEEDADASVSAAEEVIEEESVWAAAEVEDVWEEAPAIDCGEVTDDASVLGIGQLFVRYNLRENSNVFARLQDELIPACRRLSGARARRSIINGEYASRV